MPRKLRAGPVALLMWGVAVGASAAALASGQGSARGFLGILLVASSVALVLVTFPLWNRAWHGVAAPYPTEPRNLSADGPPSKRPLAAVVAARVSAPDPDRVRDGKGRKGRDRMRASAAQPHRPVPSPALLEEGAPPGAAAGRQDGGNEEEGADDWLGLSPALHETGSSWWDWSEADQTETTSAPAAMSRLMGNPDAEGSAPTAEATDDWLGLSPPQEPEQAVAAAGVGEGALAGGGLLVAGGPTAEVREAAPGGKTGGVRGRGKGRPEGRKGGALSARRRRDDERSRTRGETKSSKGRVPPRRARGSGKRGGGR